MLRSGFLISLLLLASVQGVPGADRTTVTKEIHGSSGPWIVTLSINREFPYGGAPAPPAVFSAADGLAFQAGDVLTVQYHR